MTKDDVGKLTKIWKEHDIRKETDMVQYGYGRNECNSESLTLRIIMSLQNRGI